MPYNVVMAEASTIQPELNLHAVQIMGIINVTPDSFYAASRPSGIPAVLRAVEAMLTAGASIIDIGGESTRPNAKLVTEDEELARVIPIIQAIRHNFAAPISVDTSKPAVMQAAVDAGATLINDVRALREPGAIAMAAKLAVPICLMHMQGTPQTMQQAPVYFDVVTEVQSFFADKLATFTAAGIKPNNIILDPGFGFGKTLTHNIQLLQNLQRFKEFGCPLLVGISRKSMIGLITGKSVEDRLYGSLAANVIAIMHGANIIRTHDVAATVDAIKVVTAMVKN